MLGQPIRGSDVAAPRGRAQTGPWQVHSPPVGVQFRKWTRRTLHACARVEGPLDGTQVGPRTIPREGPRSCRYGSVLSALLGCTEVIISKQQHAAVRQPARSTSGSFSWVLHGVVLKLEGLYLHTAGSTRVPNSCGAAFPHACRIPVPPGAWRYLGCSRCLAVVFFNSPNNKDPEPKPMG